jgi:hypothetical protein
MRRNVSSVDDLQRVLRHINDLIVWHYTRDFGYVGSVQHKRPLSMKIRKRDCSVAKSAELDFAGRATDAVGVASVEFLERPIADG